MEFTNRHRKGGQQSLDQYLAQLKERIPSLTSRPIKKREVDLGLEARWFKAHLDKVSSSGLFIVDPDKRDAMNSVFAWIWKLDKWNTLNLDYNKGFFLYGPIGTGKSTFMKGLAKYMNSIKRRTFNEDRRLGFYWKSASELTNYYVGGGQEKLLQWRDDCNLLIDELGREPCPASHYGNELNVIQFLLQLRYDHRKDNITHITSNVTPQDIMPIYGDYISDRFREMFNIIPWFGASKR